jgi:hypothetical protein
MPAHVHAYECVCVHRVPTFRPPKQSNGALPQPTCLPLPALTGADQSPGLSPLSPVAVVVMPGSGAPHQSSPRLWVPMAIFLLVLQR